MEDVELVNKETTEDSIKEDRRWCVYIHRNKVNNKCYIGQTCEKPLYRWGRDGSGYKPYYNRKSYFWNAICKYGWDNFEHIIFADNLSKNIADKMEILLIKLYDTTNPSYGYNVAPGGSGCVASGEKNPFYGKHHSEKSKQQMSESKKGMYDGDKNPMYGKNHTEETRRKMSDNHADFRGEKHPRYGHSEQYTGIHNGNSRHVYCVELQQIFVTMSEAVKTVGVTTISGCCRKLYNYAGKHPITGEPLHWFYTDDAIQKGYITQQQLDDYLNSLRNKGDMSNEN